MTWQSIWSVAELLKRLSIVSSGNNLLNGAQPLMNDASWNSAFLFSPSFPLSQNALDRLWTELDFQLSPCSPLSFPPSPDTHTKHAPLPEEAPLVWMGREVCLIRLSSPPGDGSHPPGSRGVCPISPSTTHTSTQGWSDQPCLCAWASWCLCVCTQECFHMHAFHYLLSVCTHHSFMWRSEGSTSDFQHKTLSVNLIMTQPADAPQQNDKLL